MGKAKPPTGWREAEERVQEQLRQAETPGRAFYARCWCGLTIVIDGGPGASAELSRAVSLHIRAAHAELWEEMESMYRMGVHRAFADIFLESVLPKGGESG